MKKTESHIHHHWEGTGVAIVYLLKWLLVFVIVMSLVSIIQNSSDNKEYMYKSCLNACDKPFSI